MVPDLYNIVADSLMRRLRLPRAAYSDDFKFVGHVAVSRAVIQTEIDIVANWSTAYKMLLSIKES